MAEKVRLVIWDLDDTFWRGTLSEGGITEYVRANHDIVVELAKRGIISSICSKNDEVVVKEVLERENIGGYFVFPSISWEPKGQRVLSIVEAAQLRPASVMFIDDNHLNRAEVADLIPDIQIESDAFIPQILADARFQGKDDAELTRLGQYKLLESRKQDEVRSGGSNREFLRSCNIRVFLEYDVDSHIDRAIELINRTNQLNFTKLRLPEDIESARAELTSQLRSRVHQGALIKVVDKYGDYGFVGFYLLKNGGADPVTGRLVPKLEHFCFSCRTLGMLVEAFVFELLQRPQLQVAGEVLTDLFEERTIDWITLASAGQVSAGETKTFSEIRVHGGCEAQSIAHYLTPHAERVAMTGNFNAGVAFYRVNGSTLLLSACDRSGEALRAEAEVLEIPYNMLVMEYLKDPSPGAVFILGCQLDLKGSYRYRHRTHGWELYVEPHGLGGLNLVEASEEEIAARVEGPGIRDELKKKVATLALHVHRNYRAIRFDYDRDFAPAMNEIFARVPLGSKVVLITDHTRERASATQVKDAPWTTMYHRAASAIAAQHAFVRVVSFRDHVRDDDEIQVGGNHYDRLVYLRVAEAIISELREMPAKAILHEGAQAA